MQNIGPHGLEKEANSLKRELKTLQNPKHLFILVTITRRDDNHKTSKQHSEERGPDPLLILTGPEYPRTDIRKYSYTLRVVEPWNQLPGSRQGGIQESHEEL